MSLAFRWFMALFCPPMLVYMLYREIGFSFTGRLIVVVVGLVYDLIFGFMLSLPIVFLMAFLEEDNRMFWHRHIALFGIIVWVIRWLLAGNVVLGWLFILPSVLGVVSVSGAFE